MPQPKRLQGLAASAWDQAGGRRDCRFGLQRGPEQALIGALTRGRAAEPMAAAAGPPRLDGRGAGRGRDFVGPSGGADRAENQYPDPAATGRTGTVPAARGPMEGPALKGDRTQRLRL